MTDVVAVAVGEADGAELVAAESFEAVDSANIVSHFVSNTSFICVQTNKYIPLVPPALAPAPDVTPLMTALVDGADHQLQLSGYPPDL